MADLRGVGKEITYREDNPISTWVEEFRQKRNSLKREPKDQPSAGFWHAGLVIAAGVS
jgi:hypothetical protein